MLKIEPVSAADRPRALLVLTGRQEGGADRARALEKILSGPRGDECRLWWARSLRGPRAAAMTMPGAGRCTMLFYTLPDNGGAPVDTLARLIDEIAAAALTDGAAFVQGMTPPQADRAAEAFEQAGYLRLAELIYMNRRLRNVPTDNSALTWRGFSVGDEGPLGEIIAATYAGSRDCPALLGLRTMADVIASHKAGGIFRPESWWLPTFEGETIGCLLVNDAAGRKKTTELVYLGVRPQWRRRGLARAMLRHAMNDGARRHMAHMRLAVDSTNLPAVDLYEQEGFTEMDRRVVYIKPPRDE